MASQEPIFKPIFGDSWRNLPPVMHKHYRNRPYCDDVTTVEGRMDVICKWYLRPMFWLLHTVPPYSETDIPVTVHFTSAPDSADFGFNRIFRFTGRKPFHFRSRMTQVTGSEVAERMRFGIRWHSNYCWDGRRVTLQHKGYSLQVGNVSIPLPVTWLIGRGDAYESPVDDQVFDMSATITHPLLGTIYQYRGRFTVMGDL